MSSRNGSAGTPQANTAGVTTEQRLRKMEQARARGDFLAVHLHAEPLYGRLSAGEAARQGRLMDSALKTDKQTWAIIGMSATFFALVSIYALTR